MTIYKPSTTAGVKITENNIKRLYVADGILSEAGLELDRLASKAIKNIFEI